MAIETSISQQILILEKKAAAFDQLVDRVAALSTFIVEWDNLDLKINKTPYLAQINPVRDMVNAYKDQTAAFKQEVLEQGFRQGVPVKYKDSLYDGLPIEWVKVHENGDVVIKTVNGEDFCANIDGPDFDLTHSIDYVLCRITTISGLTLRK